MRLTVSGPRHWVLDLGRVEISCWGRPRVRLFRRAWARRYDDPPEGRTGRGA